MTGGESPVAVTRPSDAVEQEADLVAQQVAAHDPNSDGPVAAAATLPRIAVAIAPPALPPPLDAALTNGSVWSAADRAPVEAALGVDLSAISVHTGEAAATAAAAIGARAFTVGSAVVLGAGESPADPVLMAHETTHVLQGTSGPLGLGLARWAVGPTTPIRRDEADGVTTDDSILPDWLRDMIASAVRAVPGYTIASAAVGQDLLTGQALTTTPEQLLEQVLAAGPFGPGVSLVLQSCQVIGEIVGLVRGALANHDLTLARIAADLARAWDEVHVIDGVDANVAVVARYIRSFLADVVAAATEIADAVIALVRAAVVDLVEPLVTSSALAPVWQLFCKVVHHDPLRDVEVPATTVEILTDFLHLIGKDEALERMTENGTLQRTADWIDTQLGTFFALLGSARQLFLDAWAAISPQNLTDLPDTLPGLVDRAVSLVRGIVDFGTTLVRTVVEFIKDALLARLSSWAHGTRGFPLFTVVLGRDPFTGESVPRTAEALIGGFIRLLPGGDQTFQQLSESGVIAAAGARIETAMTELGISWDMVIGLFHAIWDGLSLSDLVDPIGCFVRIVDQFGEPLGRLVTFAGVVVRTVVELILQAMHFPGELLGQIVAGVQQAIDDITADPVRFLNTLIAALKNGFLAFFDHLGTHLLAGLAAWLFRGLASLGITIPSEVTGESILGLVAQVLGLSVDLLWERLAAQIGQERVDQIRGAIDRLTGAWAFIADVQERGFPAIWDFVAGQLSNLWEMILSAAEQWIMTTVVERAIAKVISMLDPTGVMAVINSCIAFFNAVQSVIDYATEILQIVKRYVDTIAAIAQGNAGPGAVQVEGGLAAAVPVAIGFLANQIGLGSIPEKLVEIIQGIREQVVAAIDWVIAQALRIGQAVLNALGMGSDPPADSVAGPPLTEAEHPAYAMAAGTALVAAIAAAPQRDASEVATEYAASHEDQLSQRLQPGIRLRFLLPPPSPTAPSGSFTFDVQIAPNTTTVHLSAPITNPDIPLHSAPGLGEVQRHGSKPPSNRTGPAIWHLTSEHIVPFDLGRTVWTVFGAAIPGRGGWEDRDQTTIMIYAGAALAKTHQTDAVTGRTERQISAAFAAMPGLGSMAARVDSAETRAEDTSRGVRRRDRALEQEVREVIVVISDALEEAKDYCIARTVDGIRTEHGTTEAGFTLTNGARRAESSPLPTDGEVSSAAEAQIASLWAIFQRAALARGAGVN